MNPKTHLHSLAVRSSILASYRPIPEPPFGGPDAALPKAISFQFAVVCLVTAAMTIANAGEIVPITAVTGSNGGDQYANGMDSLTNGSGITKTNPLDPSTWTLSGSAYGDEWMAWYLKAGGVVTPGLNGKLAWAAFDVGTKQSLGTLYLFNNNYQAGISGMAQYNLYYADSPAVALPAKPAKNTYSNTGLTPQGDYDFSSGGWTLFNTLGTLTATKEGITTVDLPGVSARYLAVEILTNYGDTYQGGRVGFDEIAVTTGPPDSDGDGFPDDYELLHTDPPSTTALNRDDDLEPDGLTNWQEYLIGTNPRNPDTDGDGLTDGAEVAGAGLRPPTNPLLADTDGDGLSDLVETNSGVWGGISDPGTNPANADTDGDGLKDGVETNTGVFVSLTNTGTNPLNPDTDGDGVGDWYEIYSSFTDPFDANDKPIVPYPLPTHDGSPGVSDKPVKVYIMSGQSNMVGEGTVSGTDDKSLETMTRRLNRFPNLIDSEGNFIARQDVRYRGVIRAIGNGPLAPGFGKGSGFFGPELGFGQIMGWYHDEPVLLLKSSEGNRALGWDILPPGGVRYPYGDSSYPAYGESPESWLTTSQSEGPRNWYAGKQYDDFFLNEPDMGMRMWMSGIAYPNGCQVKHNGLAYNSRSAHTSGPENAPQVDGDGNPVQSTQWNPHNVTNVVDVLDKWVAEYAESNKPFPGQDFEIAGFVWWQGDRDRNNMAHATRYEENLVRLITSLRGYYSNRYPGKVAANAPFVLATLGQTTLDSTNATEKAILDAKFAVDGRSGKYSQFAGNVRTVYAHPLSEGGASNGHYNQRAGTYLLIGDALGRAMVELQEAVAPPGSGYASWVNGPFSGTLTNTDPALDFDGGGLATGIEWVLGGDPTDPGDDASITPTLDTTSDPDGKVLFVFRRNSDAHGDSNTTIHVQYGSNLGGWTNAVHQGTGASQITITEQANGFASGIDKVTVALPSSLAASGKLFARLNVTTTP